MGNFTDFVVKWKFVEVKKLRPSVDFQSPFSLDKVRVAKKHFGAISGEKCERSHNLKTKRADKV